MTWEPAENLEHSQDAIKDYWHRKRMPLPLEISLVEFQYTDIILAIKPEFAEAIHTQKKNYEYRKYLIQPTVTQFWLYETEPIKKIRYVITVGLVKTPGEVNDPLGQGNDDFNKGLKKSKFGYPILALDQLNNPLNEKDMKRLIGLSPPL